MELRNACLIEATSLVRSLTCESNLSFSDFNCWITCSAAATEKINNKVGSERRIKLEPQLQRWQILMLKRRSNATIITNSTVEKYIPEI